MVTVRMHTGSEEKLIIFLVYLFLINMIMTQVMLLTKYWQHKHFTEIKRKYTCYESLKDL